MDMIWYEDTMVLGKLSP